MATTGVSPLEGLVPMASTTTQTKTTSNAQQTMGKDSFLKLLLAQMQYQDPLNPMEGVEFTAQLAQFTSLEQLYNINDKFTSLNSALQAQNNYQAINLVGKDGQFQGNNFAVLDGKSTGGALTLQDAAASVSISVYDENGSLVRIMDLGAMAAGEHDLSWDGKDQKGSTVADGTYTFTVAALDSERKAVASRATMVGKITGVKFGTDGTPTLMMNGLSFALGQMLEVKSTTEAESQ
jgi:flagellar basal-body rod modification protein FlgD